MSSAVSIDHGGAPAALRPAASTVGRPATPARSRWWVELLAIAWLLFLYDAVTNLAPLRLSVALGNARGILHAEQVLHLDPELTLDRWLAGHHTIASILANYYDNAHFVVTLGLLGYLWWSRSDIYRPLRNVLVLVNVMGFVVFWLLPVAPPRMLDGFTDVVAATHAFGSWHTGALASQANQLAAMPSLHMAWAGWCALALWRISERRWVRVLALLYPCLTALAVLATGNHFVFDIIGGLLVLAFAVLLVGSPKRLVGRVTAARMRAAWVALRPRRVAT
ncbi:MAG TPA: phosphatase PAP2 family protein [Solirubrobacteraceae bacterium]|nr:phosphatase PAP2 family protein [Solirubrobacteraceae bacterium]